MAPAHVPGVVQVLLGLDYTAINARNTLNRKYLLEAIDPSLERFGLDHLDIVYCHRSNPQTPVEETVRAMSDVVSSGRAHYWGTSEWSADEIRAAWDIVERHHLHKPVVEQPEYNLFNRRKVEREYRRLYGETGIGLTTWSPLASGLLTGNRYFDGVPEGSRAPPCPATSGFVTSVTDTARNDKVRRLAAAADDLGLARWRSSPSHGASATPTSPPSSLGRAGSSRSTRTWPRSTMSSLSTTRTVDRIEKAMA